MSTARDYVTKTELTPAALNGMLTPIVSILYFGGIPKLPNIMPMLWAALFPTTMPVYLTQAGAVFSWSAIVAGLIRYFASQKLAEAMQVEGRVKTIGYEDRWVFLFYWAWWIAVMLYLGIPFTVVTVLQGSLMVGLLMSFYSVPWYLTKWFTIPSETDDLAVKTWVFILTIVLAGVFTTVALFGMRAIEFCSLYPAHCPLP